MSKVMIQALGGAALVAVGLAAGWYVAEASHGHAGDDSAGPGTSAVGASVLSAQALRNLGVRIEAARATDFVESLHVQATVVDAPRNARPVVSELGGSVTEVHVRPGERVAPGDPLVTLVRAEIARPELPITGGLLPTLSEDVHAAVAAYRNAHTHVTIVQRELDRVLEFTETGTSGGLPVLPLKTRIDLEYDLVRAQQDLANALHEIERHGLRADAVTGGSEVPVTRTHDLWRRALAAAGFWSATEDEVLDALPEPVRTVPWVIGALGELAATGRSGPKIAAAVRDVPALRAHFADALALLLSGHSVARVRLLAESGSLDPVVVRRAPSGAPDWDVDDVDVQPGQRIEAGDDLLHLHDAREMWLLAEPVGDEIGAVVRAYSAGDTLRATSLLPDAAPELEDLRIDRLATRGGEHERGARAYVRCVNTALDGGPSGARTWGLREGLQYVLHVPRRRIERCFVLPSEAVVQLGPERVVLVEDGDAFRTQPVHVEFEDAGVVVISDDGALFDGDPVVVSGAFALSLSLRGSDAGADPHAGHDH